MRRSTSVIGSSSLCAVTLALALGCGTAPEALEEADVPADDALAGAEAIVAAAPQGQPVVLVHGNAGYPSDWNNTISYFKSHGYSDADIIAPSWGSKTCPACNDHCGSELDAITAALTTAMSRSTSGQIDVMGHSMGATLAAKAILAKGWGPSQVRTFVGIAGAFRGLNSCGVYPYNVPTTTCGSCGLSIGSPLVSSLANKRWAALQYTIYSYYDEIVCNCAWGYNMTCCYVYGVHTSKPQVSDGNYQFTYGHYGLQAYTYDTQYQLCTR